ncbi:hypothetical protein [Larkinella soli]|uniref:hypothetical protein n=1 Tax=Larkinella soli TaxID=1770527 RepID=UPI000FFBE005|nr:hypothetical protein [Larkinella soli]
MQTFSVQILNPKAVRLLKDLADLKLIALTEQKEGKSRAGKLEHLLLNGPTWTASDYDQYLQNRAELDQTGEHDPD